MLCVGYTSYIRLRVIYKRNYHQLNCTYSYTRANEMWQGKVTLAYNIGQRGRNEYRALVCSL